MIEIKKISGNETDARHNVDKVMQVNLNKWSDKTADDFGDDDDDTEEGVVESEIPPEKR